MNLADEKDILRWIQINEKSFEFNKSDIEEAIEIIQGLLNKNKELKEVINNIFEYDEDKEYIEYIEPDPIGLDSDIQNKIKLILDEYEM